jgi:hypothetical protein
MFSISESTKTFLAMFIGGVTSIGAGMINIVKGYSIKIIASIPMFSFEYLEMLITAFLLGVAGALGGLLIRESFKAFMNYFFPGYLNKTKNNGDEE